MTEEIYRVRIIWSDGTETYEDHPSSEHWLERQKDLNHPNKPKPVPICSNGSYRPKNTQTP